MDRRIIDGHAHILPRRPLPWHDALSGTTLHPCGRLENRDGSFRWRMPPYFCDSAFPAQALLALMDAHGVSHAVVMVGLEEQTEEIALDVAARHPERLRAAVSLPPQKDSAERLQRLWQRGVRLLKFEMRSLAEIYPSVTLCDPAYEQVLAQAERLGIPVVVDPGPVDFACYRPDCLREQLEKHPGLRLVLCHLAMPPTAKQRSPELIRRWRDMISLAERFDVSFDMSAMPDLFPPYPFAGAHPYLREIYECVGAQRLIWGSDVPGTLNHAAYEQMIHMVDAVDFFTGDDKRQVLYETARRVYFSE